MPAICCVTPVCLAPPCIRRQLTCFHFHSRPATSIPSFPLCHSRTCEPSLTACPIAGTSPTPLASLRLSAVTSHHLLSAYRSSLSPNPRSPSTRNLVPRTVFAALLYQSPLHVPPSLFGAGCGIVNFQLRNPSRSNFFFFLFTPPPPLTDRAGLYLIFIDPPNAEDGRHR